MGYCTLFVPMNPLAEGWHQLQRGRGSRGGGVRERPSPAKVFEKETGFPAFLDGPEVNNYDAFGLRWILFDGEVIRVPQVPT